MVKYSKAYLARLENLFAESDYTLRYEKGNFKSGYCILNDNKIILVNNYYPLEGKVNCLIDLVKQLNINTDNFSDKSLKLYQELLAGPENVPTLFD